MNNRSEHGIIQIILVIVVAIIILSYLGFSLRDIMEHDTTQENFSYIGELFKRLWNNIFKAPCLFIWHNILVPITNAILRAVGANTI